MNATLMNKTLWRRMRRLLGQSRIRLSAAELRVPRLAVGDRLEIGGRAWRIAAREPSAGEERGWRLIRDLGAGVELHARLLEPAASSATGAMVLELDGERIPLCFADLVHYPCGDSAVR